MPKPWQSWFKRFFYNLNIKRDKSGSKYKKLLNHLVLLAKKTEKEGETKWLSNAFQRAQVKISRYGIPLRHVVSVLAHKNISSLLPIVQKNIIFVKKKGV